MIALARDRLLRAVAAWLAAWWAFVCERGRMRLSAALMDAGAHLALDPVERRARRLRRRMHGRWGRRLGPHGMLLAMGATELAGEATLLVGARTTASGRALSLLCVAVEGHEAPEAARLLPGVFAGAPSEGSPEFYWAVRTQAADAPPGFAGARTSMLHEREGALETALVAFFAEPVPRALAGLNRAEHHEPAGEGLGTPEGSVTAPEIGEAPAA